MPKARSHLRLIACALACCVSLAAQPLRQLAGQRGIHIGAATDPSHFSETLYAGTLGREFNQLEPENAMKFGPIHPGPTTYNFGPPDALVAFARANNMAVRGHTLVWHNQIPSWLTGGNFSPSQLSTILHDHINTVVGRYAGQVYAWDVVNEAFNDNGTLRSTIWSDSPGIGLAGTAYIEQVLRWAHDADPQALLFYNDYSAEVVNSKSDAIYKMAQDFKARGVPIHGIGLQMHFTAGTGSLASMESNIKRITALGLQVHITELDVRLPVDSSGTASAANLATQAQIYHDITALCLKFPLCTAIQTWGFTDKYSWIPGTFPGQGAALEFDTGYQPKPAYNSIAAALQTSPPVISAANLTNAASYRNDAVSPGEIIVLFGATFGPESLVIAQADPSGILPGLFSDTRLLFDGVAAPILYTRVGQTGAVVPFSVAGNATTQMQYEYQGVRSNSVTVNVAPTRPGLFTLDSSGQGAGAILDTSYRVVSQSNPVRAGDFILVYATGGGATTPQSVDGQIPLVPPFPVVLATVTASIGGVDCPVSYSGGAYGLVAGALQINVQVAQGVPSGEQPISIKAGDAVSQAGVTVWVQ
jgi:endo-1,4-beta-xylanase